MTCNLQAITYEWTFHRETYREVKMKAYYLYAGLELKKISKSPFGDYRRKTGRQMQKCSRQIVQV